MLELIIRNVNLADGRTNVDIAISEGLIKEISPAIAAQGAKEIDGGGHLATAPFVDSHFHMDSALTLGQPRLNQSGTLLEGIALWGELKPSLTVESIKTRALEVCKLAIARGTLHIRSHVDVCDDRLIAVEALLEVQKEIKPYLDLQLVAFPQDGFLRYSASRENLLRALDMGVDVVGGIPHFERTMEDGAESVRQLCAIAAERGLRIDMHCDETDDPNSRHIETLAKETLNHGLQGRVTGSHLTSMHSMDNYYVSKLIPLIAEAEVHAIANPVINICIGGRHDSYPKRRGMTRVPELMDAGINVSFGQDCIMDPWYSLGSHDMLDVASMGLHVGLMTSIQGMNNAFNAVTTNGAITLGLENYGLETGCQADVVILQAANPIEALRIKPARLFVIRKGQVIATTPPVFSEVMVPGITSKNIDFCRDMNQQTGTRKTNEQYQRL